MVPDTIGVAAGGEKTYTFLASNPGTYLYEAGLLPNAEHQVAMGLYGALVVRPATPGQAYSDIGVTPNVDEGALTTYDDEAVLVISELDPALNTSLNPAAFDMRNFAPKYFLINGKVYPDTDLIASDAGRKVLLRYLNAGAKHHSMAVLGLRQNFVAKDASLLPSLSHNVVAETLAPGQTGDAIAIVPASATTASRFAVYDASLMLHNNGAPGFGGMLTFVTAGTGAGTTGPLVTALSLVGSNLSATIAASTGSVAAAEYWFDSVATHNGIPISPAPTVTITNYPVTLPVASGNHSLYVRGQDSSGNWGAPRSVSFVVDMSGPITSGLTLTPNPSSGTVNVALHATGNDTTTGGSNITAAEYFIGTTGADGTGRPMTINVAAPIASLDAMITAPVTPGLVSVHSMDALGHWGSFATIDLNVTTGGPVTTSVTAAPNPNNGTLPLNSSQPVVRVTAMIEGTGSTVSGAEGFIDTPPANTSVRGFPFVPSDGAWNGGTEKVTADIPLANINALSTGNHTIFVRGKDATGAWGVATAMTLVIDRTAPTISTAAGSTRVTPSASNNAPVTISGTGADTPCPPATCAIGGGEYYIDAIGAAGTGGAMSVTSATTFSGTIPTASLSPLSAGNHTIYVRARDAAGNWSTGTASATLLIDRTAPTFSSITLNPNSTAAGTPVTLTLNGATDPLVNGLASGVAGGEWWLGSTNIAAGTGTAFTGLSTTLPTTSLGGCTATVRSRIRDVATNWSTGNGGVRTATLTVTGTPADAIFADGFETGPLSGNSTTAAGNWSSRSTATESRVDFTTPAALVGTYGLQVQGNNTNYVQYNFGACPPAAPTFDARFYFNPNGFTPNAGGNVQDIFVAASNTGFSSTTTRFRVRYRNAGTPQVQIQLGTSTSNTAWTNINGTSGNAIEVVWQSGQTLQLYVNGVLAQTLTGAATASVVAVRLGSVTDAGSNGNTTLEYFDAFVSKRSVSPLIGP